MAHRLSGQGLTLIRGERCLFEALDFSVASGELLTIEGANGSGKTSLLRGIAGLTGFEEGLVRWNEANVKRNRQAFHANLAWMSHRPGFKGDLTAWENLRFEAGLNAMTMTVAGPRLDRLGIAHVADLPFRALSAGQQRRLALGRMILSEAPLWLMDEPFTNLDRSGQELVVELLAEHLRDGGLCIMATHQRFELDVTVHRVRLE